MESLNQTGSDSPVADPPETQEVGQHQVQEVESHGGRLDDESILESSESSLAVYEPNQQVLREIFESREQNSNIEPLITYMKELKAENKNLEQVNSDLTVTNAELQTQIDAENKSHENKIKQLSDAEKEVQRLSEANAELRQRVTNFEAMLLDSANSNKALRELDDKLRNQLRDKNKLCEEKSTQLFDAEEEIKQITEENSDAKKTIIQFAR